MLGKLYYRRRFLQTAALFSTSLITSITTIRHTSANVQLSEDELEPEHKLLQVEQPGLILTPGPKGWWDSERVSCPRVLRDRFGIWRMWYYGRDPSFDREINLPTGRCGLAISRDGIQWRRVRGPLTKGSVFEPSSDLNRFDSAHVGVSDIQFAHNQYWMSYFGGNNTVSSVGQFKAKGFPLRPGFAVSNNGINWQRIEGPYRGAILDVGQPGEFDAAYCGWPQVLHEEDGTSKLYYHTLNPEEGFQIGLAVSWELVLAMS